MLPDTVPAQSPQIAIKVYLLSGFSRATFWRNVWRHKRITFRPKRRLP